MKINQPGTAFIPKYFVPTGSMLVNQHLYKGGIPAGSILQIQSSGEGTFKSSELIRMAANAQSMGLKVAYIDAEGACNFELDENGLAFNPWFEQLGLKSREIYYVDAGSGEELWEAIFELIEDHGVQFVVLDSIHSTAPSKLHDADVGDHMIGGHAQLHTKALVKALPIIRKHQAIITAVNHKRVNMTAMGAMGEKPGGGKGWGFYSQFIFVFSRTTSKSKLEGEDLIPLEVYIEKNKGGKQFIKIDTFARQGYGIDNGAELAVLAEEKGLIRKAGSWWKTAEGETIGQGDARFGWALLNQELILQ